MTDCPRGDMRDLLPDLLHERLDAATRAEVARHVASCAACAEELELLRSMRRALSSAPHVDVARIAAAAAAATRGTAPDAPNVRRLAVRTVRRADRRMAWRIAAAFVIAALGASGWVLLRGGPRTPALPVAAAPPHADSAAAPPTVVAAQPHPPSHSRAVTTAPAQPKTLASTGLVMDGGVKDLSDGDVRMLLQSLDSLSAMPDADPTPMSYQIDDDGGAR